MTLKDAVDQIREVSEPHADEFEAFWMNNADCFWEQTLQQSNSAIEVIMSTFRFDETPQGVYFWVNLINGLETKKEV